MGLVNTVVPLEQLERETVRWCREMLQLSPFALRLLKASFNAAEDGLSGIQQLAHDANLLFYGARRRRRAGTPTGRSARRTSGSSPSGRERRGRPSGGAARHSQLWLLAARPRTLPAAVAPVLVGTSLAAAQDEFRALAVRRRAGGQRLHPDRHEPLERLLRRPPRRRHRGAARARARDRRRPDAAASACWSGPTSRSPLRWRPASTWLRSPAGSCWWSASHRSSPACSTPAAPAPTATRASASCSCSSSSAWWPSSGSYYVQAEELRWEAFALAVPVGLLASAILVVNNVRDIDTDRRAGKRTLAVKLGRDRARLLYTAMLVVAFAVPPATWLRRPDRLAAAHARRACRWPRR